jgi:hypothetical protein
LNLDIEELKLYDFEAFHAYGVEAPHSHRVNSPKLTQPKSLKKDFSASNKTLEE